MVLFYMILHENSHGGMDMDGDIIIISFSLKVNMRQNSDMTFLCPEIVLECTRYYR